MARETEPKVIKTVCSSLTGNDRIYRQLLEGRVIILSYPKAGAKTGRKKAKPKA
jgi:hypothetical protein